MFNHALQAVMYSSGKVSSICLGNELVKPDGTVLHLVTVRAKWTTSKPIYNEGESDDWLEEMLGTCGFEVSALTSYTQSRFNNL